MVKTTNSLKKLNPDIYYLLLAYKSNFLEDFKRLFGEKGLGQLSPDQIMIWYGFTTGKMYTQMIEYHPKLE